MDEPRHVEAFLKAVSAEIGPPSPAEEHALRVAAKRARLVVESGQQLANTAWAALFPDERVRRIAQRDLAGVSVVNLDFAATMHAPPPKPGPRTDETMATSPEGVQRRWHALVISIPQDGLPRDDGRGMVTGLELGRLVLTVSQGKGRVRLEELPTAGGFRDRFLDAARNAGRLALIDGADDSRAAGG